MATTKDRQQAIAKANKGKLYHQLKVCPRCASEGSLVYHGDHVNCEVCDRTYPVAYLHKLAEEAKKR